MVPTGHGPYQFLFPAVAMLVFARSNALYDSEPYFASLGGRFACPCLGTDMSVNGCNLLV